MSEERNIKEAIKRVGSQQWADTLQPMNNGKPNHDYYKVYGEQGLKKALNQPGIKLK